MAICDSTLLMILHFETIGYKMTWIEYGNKEYKKYKNKVKNAKNKRKKMSWIKCRK